MTDPVLGFPAFARGLRRIRGFAASWWGRAWLRALEETALDPEPLRQGRRYAYTGRVGPITVSPGRIATTVYGDSGAPYRTVVLIERLTDRQWERFLDAVAAKAGYLAALLDRDVPHDLVEAATAAGVRLLPGLGDLQPECDCPDWEFPCRHAAALCHQVAWLLDADPFVLLLMRGRGERELLDELHRRNVAGTGAGPPTPAPVSAAVSAATTAPGVDRDALARLAADAAVRARELLTVDPPPPELDLWQDTVRLAATHADPLMYARLERSSGRPAELTRAVRAWRYGGPAALDVLTEAWTPPPARLAAARAALTDAWDTDEFPEPQVWRNRWTVSGRGLQLRYGRDGRWYPYRREAGAWWPAGPPQTDPVAALTELLG